MNELPPLPANLPNVVRRIRACEGEIAAQVVFEHALNDHARAAIEAHEVRKVPDGWKLVPIEPTKEMIDAYVRDPHRFFSARTDWAAMLASAPPAPQHENETINKLRAGYPAAIDAAIREQASVVKQEPFGYVSLHTNGQYAFSKTVAGVYRDTAKELHTVYTRPAPVREPLTDNEIDSIICKHMHDINSPEGNPVRKLNAYRSLVRSGEQAAHGITKDTP